MSGIIRLAFSYLRSQWKLAVTLVVIIGLAIALPITANRVVSRYERELTARSASPPLLVGARGDRFDLVLRSQFFVGELQQSMTYGEFASLKQNEELVSAPLHLVHSSGQGAWPVVGTTSVYLTAQQLELERGAVFAELGTCVVGAEVAEWLQGASTLKTDLPGTFGFGDMIPYDLQVVGSLVRSNSPDDRAVFVSLETAWLLDGYGHVHQESDVGTAVNRNSYLHGVPGAHIPADSEAHINSQNRHLVHFHGDRTDYRISAVGVWPVTSEASALLKVGYQDNRQLQIVVPHDEFGKLMQQVVKVKDVLDLVFALLLFIAVVMVITTTYQSVQLRQTHLETMRYLGCAVSRVRLLLITEFGVLAGFAVLTSILFTILFEAIAPSLLSLF